jgi:hypothetical protein
MICIPHSIFFGRKIEKDRDGRNMWRMWERRGVYSILVMNPDGKKNFGTTRGKWEDNIKMEFQEL